MAQALDDVVASSMIPDDVAPDIDEELEREPGDPGRFRITDEGAAEWALRKLRKISAQLTANSALAATERARIDQWEAEVNASLQKSADFFLGLLAEYHHGVLEQDVDRRTIKLPAGVLKARKRPDRWEIDEDAFIAWAKANRPELVRIVEQVDRAATKKVLVAKPKLTSSAADPDTGEIAPGVKVIVGDVAFTVEVTA